MLTYLLFGAVCLSMAGMASIVDALLQAALSIFGIVGGPLLGIFSLGILLPFANAKKASAPGTTGEEVSKTSRKAHSERGRSPGPKKDKGSSKRHHCLDREGEPSKDALAKKSKVQSGKPREHHGPEPCPPSCSKSPSPPTVPSVHSPPVLEAVVESPLHRLPRFVSSDSESEGEIRDDILAPTPGPSTLHKDRATLGT
ncbi:hypothetical protein JD844_028178 [Phrynosoma platyrhinos]|uniref:Uncharacterized protein n=1 Tax=Phrynosoma platyrhinos TaxID=52577 RepID=A0ABQ7SHH5_PHRPL|nr:hypothetical protein JD844_028178 [Phrynosoma platyrhinos]